jgi:hypothetical protein
VNFVWHWPQIALVVWIAMETGVQIAKHGQPRDGAYDAWTRALIPWAIMLGLLYYGGFFTDVRP